LADTEKGNTIPAGGVPWAIARDRETADFAKAQNDSEKKSRIIA
jgi:hypothetical protein